MPEEYKIHIKTTADLAAAEATHKALVQERNDLVALGLLRGLRQLGIAVPGQISLVGYDDAEFASALDPALTTVRQSPEAMGAAAARLLVSSRDTNDVPQCVRFTPELVVRASSAPPMRGRRSLR